MWPRICIFFSQVMEQKNMNVIQTDWIYLRNHAMRKLLLLATKLFILTVLILQFHSAQAVPTTSLEDWIFNIDGTIHENFVGDPLPTTGVLVDGLGTLSLDVTGGGLHSVIGYFDFEIFETFNTFFNESGAATGVPAIGQSWEVDEPGFVFGDIIDNVFAGSLDNSVSVTPGNEDDVAFAIGWDFSLLDGDIASMDFIFTDILPTVDFFLTQTDPDLGQSIYFYSSLNIQTTGSPVGPQVVPEPPVLYLMMLALLGLFLKSKLIFIRKADTFGAQ